MKTQAARAAQLIRGELKEQFPGVAFKVRSDNFSMGDSVDVYYEAELTDEQQIKLNTLLMKYQYGNFDGMTDSYNYDNDQDFPQTKYAMWNKVTSLNNV